MGCSLTSWARQSLLMANLMFWVSALLRNHVYFMFIFLNETSEIIHASNLNNHIIIMLFISMNGTNIVYQLPGGQLVTFLQSSPKEVYIDFVEFSRLPHFEDSDPGSCQVCQMVLGVICKRPCLKITYSQDHLTKLKRPEFGVGGLGTSGNKGGFHVQDIWRRVYMHITYI